MAPGSPIGLWGKVTSNVDWCEENYEYTPLIAEFWNTMSAVMVVLPNIFGTWFAIRNAYEFRFMACHLAMIVVGFGTWLFHMTLKYEMQLFDELPMTLGTVVFTYCLCDINNVPKKVNFKLLFGLSFYNILVTVIYLATDIPLLFQVSYVLMTFMCTGAAIRIALFYPCSMKLLKLAVAFYFVGMMCWVSEHHYCHHITSIRRHMFLPIRPFTQLHAIWHVLAGCGTNFLILFGVHARSLYLKREIPIKHFLRVWPYLSYGKSRSSSVPS